MAGGKHKLSARFIENVEKAGHHSDGHGLYLIVRKSGSKSWSFIWIKQGRRREMGLGGLSKVPLSLAREKAQEIREQLGRGDDPFEFKATKSKSFAEVADLLLAELAKGWTSEKHGAQWRRALKVLATDLSNKPIDRIDTQDVLSVITPVITKTPETGRRLRSRIERTLDYAKAHGWRKGENPARWKGHLENILINTAKPQRVHFSAMPYSHMPEFMKQLRSRHSTSALALQFTILTAARTGETIGAKWSEIDFQERIWNVPKERMKARLPHVVPLSRGAMRVLEVLLIDKQSDFIFHSKCGHKPISNMAMTMVLRRMKLGHFTVHGFRSTFRDYAGDKTTVAREVAEAALSHKTGNAVEAAYRRGTALQKRKELMQGWYLFCFPMLGNVSETEI